MASPTMSPFTIGGVVSFNDLFCWIDDVRKVMGFNQYTVVDLNTGISHVAFSYQLSKDFTYEILAQEWGVEHVCDGGREGESSGEVDLLGRELRW